MPRDAMHHGGEHAVHRSVKSIVPYLTKICSNALGLISIHEYSCNRQSLALGMKFWCVTTLYGQTQTRGATQTNPGK
jgi:hypothetical protein